MLESLTNILYNTNRCAFYLCIFIFCLDPGDPLTKQWLLDHYDNLFGFPSIVRFSWSTVKKLFKEQPNPITVEWGDINSDNEEDDEKTKEIKNLPKMDSFFARLASTITNNKKNNNNNNSNNNNSNSTSNSSNANNANNSKHNANANNDGSNDNSSSNNSGGLVANDCSNHNVLLRSSTPSSRAHNVSIRQRYSWFQQRHLNLTTILYE